MVFVKGRRCYGVEGLDIHWSEIDESLEIVHAVFVSYMKIYKHHHSCGQEMCP